MIRFDIQVDLPANVLSKPATRTEHIVATQAARDTSMYVPFLTGSMQNRTRVEGGTIIYEGPYARYLYEGKLMVDPSTGSSWASKGATKVVTDKNLVLSHNGIDPHATSHWFEVSKAENQEKWDRVAGKAMKRELK